LGSEVVWCQRVNAGYGLTANQDEDTYSGLIDKDPYTSDQQRQRDIYEINDRDWNEVVFEEVNGTSTAKLALHNDWINQKGYHEAAVVNLNLPEQGISGLFRITSIKHILPPKKPADENESDDYDYRPVTAIFTHVSDQVYNIDFDNGENLGVTYQHPIYSVTAGDWRLAGELEIGEEVLTKTGTATVVCSEWQEGSEVVYNLEVKELHNFLVGESGFVVHNSYNEAINKILNNFSRVEKQGVIDDAWDAIQEVLERGIFFEELLRKVRYNTDDWGWTADYDTFFPVVDFYRRVSGVDIAVSMKTTTIPDVQTWLGYQRNIDNLNGLRAGRISGGFSLNDDFVPATQVELHIYVPDTNYSQAMEAAWTSAIHVDYPDVKVVIFTIEKQLGL